MMWKLMEFCSKHRCLLRFYRCMVSVYTEGIPKKKFLKDLKIGDVLLVIGEFDEETKTHKASEQVTVCGAVYDDGFDDIIPCRTLDGEEVHFSPLCVY